MTYCAPGDVRALNSFPDATIVPDQAVESWCAQRAGELDLLLSAKSVVVPVTAPDQLVQLLKLANSYGAAAMVATNPGQSLGSEDLKAAVDVWLSEFVRLEGLISNMTRGQLLAMGVLLLDSSTALPALTPPGMVLAQNTSVRCGASPWYNYPPFRYRGDG